MLHVRLIESEGMGEGSSSGAQLALTDSELDPELEGNGAGKLSDINQRRGVGICILELSEVSEINKSAGYRALQGPGEWRSPTEGDWGREHEAQF